MRIQPEQRGCRRWADRGASCAVSSSFPEGNRRPLRQLSLHSGARAVPVGPVFSSHLSLRLRLESPSGNRVGSWDLGRPVTRSVCIGLLKFPRLELVKYNLQAPLQAAHHSPSLPPPPLRAGDGQAPTWRRPSHVPKCPGRVRATHAGQPGAPACQAVTAG